MTYGSLFSGIGGMDLGLEWAGMQCLWQCEQNDFCRKVLAKHWPHVWCYRDAKRLTDAPEVDLLCGGFPCQPHSLAGKRKGEDDDRNLWPECLRLVRRLRPRWCLFENVPGILTTMFGPVCDDLHGAGYEVWPLVLGADDVGAPHRRKRVWFVAHRSNGGRGAGVKHLLPGQSDAQGSGGKGMAHSEQCEGGPGHDATMLRGRQGEAEQVGMGSGRELGNALRPAVQRNAGSSDGAKASKRGSRKSNGHLAHGLAATGSGMGNPRQSRLAGRRGLTGDDGAEQPTAERTSDQRAVDDAERRGRHGQKVPAFGREGIPLFAWPSRPGQPQHAWEAPRVVAAQSGLGQPAHGPARRLARLRREQLKALGNMVCPQVAYVIGLAIMAADQEVTK